MCMFLGCYRIMPVQLRGALKRQVMRDLVTAMTLGWAAGAMWWFGVCQPRRTLYENFYKNYDAKAVAASMKASFEGEASLLNW